MRENIHSYTIHCFTSATTARARRAERPTAKGAALAPLDSPARTSTCPSSAPPPSPYPPPCRPWRAPPGSTCSSRRACHIAGAVIGSAAAACWPCSCRVTCCMNTLVGRHYRRHSAVLSDESPRLGPLYSRGAALRGRPGAVALVVRRGIGRPLHVGGAPGDVVHVANAAADITVQLADAGPLPVVRQQLHHQRTYGSATTLICWTFFQTCRMYVSSPSPAEPSRYINLQQHKVSSIRFKPSAQQSMN